MHVAVVGDIVAVVALRRGKKRQQPDTGDSQLLEVIELEHQTAKIADAIVIAVGEGLYVGFVDDGVFVPEGLVGQRAAGHCRQCCTRRRMGRGGLCGSAPRRWATWGDNIGPAVVCSRKARDVAW